MSNQTFDILQHISGTKNTIDVFKELEQIEEQSVSYNYLFSTPKYTNDFSKSELLISSIDTNISQLLPIDIDRTYLEYSDNDKQNYIINTESIPNFSNSELLISDYNDTTLYKIPPHTSFDAREIWESAKIDKYAIIYDIESSLLDWAFSHAHLEINNNKITKITWNSKNNYRCEFTWKAFLQWIICASLSI
jgi:hypothetical protein